MYSNGFVEGHCHTNNSDGVLSPDDLVLLAKKSRIKVLAITDHNKMLSKEKYEELQNRAGSDITLVMASEVSCNYQLLSGRTVELHIIALFPEPDSSDLTSFYKMLEKNNSYDRRPYIEAILEKLRILGMDLGTYEDLIKIYPESYIGRPQIAAQLLEKQYVKTTEEAMNRYIGDFGEKLAWVENINKKNYVDYKEVINQIHIGQGLAILCHLNYYKLNVNEEHEILKNFRLHADYVGGMEVEYRRYTEDERKRLRKLARKYSLFPSAGSDFHGVFESDGMDNYFPMAIYEEMIKRWKEYYKITNKPAHE